MVGRLGKILGIWEINGGPRLGKNFTWNRHKHQPSLSDANRRHGIWDIGYGRSRISRIPWSGRTFRGSSGIRAWLGSSIPGNRFKELKGGERERYFGGQGLDCLDFLKLLVKLFLVGLRHKIF